MRLLVVEDHEVLATAIAAGLRREGMAVDIAFDGREALARIREAGRPVRYEKEYVRKDGSRVPVLVGAATFEGKSDEGVAFVLDLTDRKRADEAVREGEARTRLILETALDAVVTMDEQGIVKEWNAQSERMFGWRYDEAVGRRLSELLRPGIV